jgi:hypothetical protein
VNASSGGSATFEVVEGVPKSGSTTWRAEVSLPRSAVGHFEGAKESFMCIRGPSRVTEKIAEEDGDKMVEAARRDGIAGCRKLQRELNSGRLDGGR